MKMQYDNDNRAFDYLLVVLACIAITCLIVAHINVFD